MNKKLKLHYITSMDYPISFATGIQVKNMAKAFAEILDTDFLLVLSSDRNHVFPGIKIIETHSYKYVKFRLRSLYNFLWVLRYTFVTPKQNNIYYFKDFRLALMAIIIKNLLHRKDIKIAVECHLLNNNKLEKYVFNNTDYIFCITTHLKKITSETYPKKIKQIHYSPDAVDATIFSATSPVHEILKRYNLPADKFLIGYIGNFSTVGVKKGVDTAIDAMKTLDAKYHLVLVGGIEKDIKHYEEYASQRGLKNKITFLGRIDHELIPAIMKSMNCLISPMPNNNFNAYYTSPLKLFEYMASGIPMIYSDLPSIRDILDESTTFFCRPGDSLSLADTIEYINEHPNLSAEKARNAFNLVTKKHTWAIRAKNIIDTFQAEP